MLSPQAGWLAAFVLAAATLLAGCGQATGSQEAGDRQDTSAHEAYSAYREDAAEVCDALIEYADYYQATDGDVLKAGGKVLDAYNRFLVVPAPSPLNPPVQDALDRLKEGFEGSLIDYAALTDRLDRCEGLVEEITAYRATLATPAP